MDDDAPGLPPYAAPERVGDQLRAAREKAGLTLAEVASRTRVPIRHLQAIEGNDYAELPSPTYASGFAKAYARAVGLDEVAIGRRVRGELAGVVRPTPHYQPVEATDPTRVPPRGLTVLALGAAVAVLILAGLYFGTSLFRGGSSAVPVAADAGTPPSIVAPTATPSPAAAPVSAGQVVVTATDEVWVRLYDADGKTLHQGTLKAGESFDVPADAHEPMIKVARPDHLRITINGAAVEGLNLGADPIKDVRISAAALAARVTPPTVPTATADAQPTGNVPRTADRSSGHRRDAVAHRRSRDGGHPPRAANEQSDTQRANLDAARTPPATGNGQ